MCAWIVPPVAGLIEPVPAPEIYIDDMGCAELIRGGIVRKGYYADESVLDGGPIQRVLKLWVRIPLFRTPLILSKNARINEFMLGEAAPPIAPAGPFRPHLVR